MADLSRSAAKAYDQLTSLQGGGERVADAAAKVGQLTAEDLDDLQTLSEAAAAVEAMLAAVVATEAAYCNAGILERTINS